MGRKNLFGPAGEGSGPEKQTSPATKLKASPAPPSAGGASPLTLLKNERKNLIRDVRTDLIDDRLHSDRLTLDGPEMDALVESIGSLGQTVPALIRPSPDRAGRFEIIYGRRRLEAVRRLGLTLRAAIHELSDDEALRIQGAENNQRLNPSFIEKALFAIRLNEDGKWSREIVCETLSIHTSILSRMLKIVSAVGPEVIEDLGPCHDVGRRQWEALAEDLSLLDLRKISRPDMEFSHLDQEVRFEAFRTEVTDRLKAAAPDPASSQSDPEPAGSGSAGKDTAPTGSSPRRTRVKIPFGRTGAGRVSISENQRAVNLSFQHGPDTEGFDVWLRENIDTVVREIQDRWIREGSEIE